MEMERELDTDTETEQNTRCVLSHVKRLSSKVIRSIRPAIISINQSSEMFYFSFSEQSCHFRRSMDVFLFAEDVLVLCWWWLG